MSIELRETDPTPVEIRPAEIFVNGRRVGEINPKKHSDNNVTFHVVLKLNHNGYWPVSNAYGYADSREAAIRDAFDKSRLGAKEYLAALDELEKEFYGEKGVPNV